MVSVQKPYPEWLQREDIPPADKPWEVTSGPPSRGDAWTDILNQRMRIPTINDDVSRVIRGHEMMHAKLSPQLGAVVPLHLQRVPQSDMLVRACEEARINFAAGRAGFDTGVLKDGSEKFAGERAAKHGDPNNIVCDVAAMANSGALNAYIAGIRKAVKAGTAKPETLVLANRVRKIITRATRKWSNNPTLALATYPTTIAVSESEDRNEYVDVNYGYRYGTLELAEQLGRLMISPPGSDGSGTEEVDTGDMPASGTRGSFARPIIKILPLTERVAGRLGRKRVATNVGRDPRRINRMLTDPDRRVFDRRAKGIGGVIVIDQSGSMHLSENDVWEIIKASPGCTIIGYSHSPGSDGVPNIWVMADRGRVVKDVPSGNGGNGVDGPALLYGLSKRRRDEPFIWVCDGYVTDSRDDHYTYLSKVCIDLVNKHGIHMVPDVPGAIEALRRVSRGDKLQANLVGMLKNM